MFLFMPDYVFVIIGTENFTFYTGRQGESEREREREGKRER